MAHYAKWHSVYGDSTVFAFTDGCHQDPGPQGLQLLCLDSPLKRGHFLFPDQPKRCLSLTVNTSTDSKMKQVWDEVPCTW